MASSFKEAKAMKYKLKGSILVLVLMFSVSAVFVSRVPASVSTFDPSWTRRRAITINNTLNTNNLNDYQVNINVDYTPSMKSDFSDLRFTDSDGLTLIPYWVESYVSQVSAVVWVKVPSIPASSTTTIYMYYGNLGASSASNGKTTFEFFDDFENPLQLGWTDKQSIPANKADGTAAVYDSELYVFGGYDNGPSDISQQTFEYDPVLNTWTQKADMPTARWGAIAVQYGGKIHVLGGQTNALANVGKYHENPLTTIPKYGADGVVHPDVVYFPGGKNGYKYWMTYTPFPPNSGENPSIVRSNDGINWTDAGISNPVVKPGLPGTFNDLENPDPDFAYVSDYDKWFMVWDPGDQATDSRKIALAYSSDGETWTQYRGASINGNTDPIILSGDDANGQSWERLGITSKLSCPTLLYENGIFYLYYAEEASGNNRGKVGLATFTWDNIANRIVNLTRTPGNPIIDLPQDSGFMSGIGHVNVAISPTNSEYYMYGVRQLVDSSSCELVLLTSTDKVSWTNEGIVLETGLPGDWDSQTVYRSSPTVDQTGKIVLFNNAIQVFYSGKDASIFNIGIAYVPPTIPHTNEVYDPTKDTWATGADVPPEIAYQGLMGVLFGNEIQLFYENYHYVYNPSTDTYTRKTDVPTPRTWATCAVVNNKIYVIGGYSIGSPSGATNVNEVYDPLTDTWQTKSPLPTALYGGPREDPIIDGKIFVTHGLNDQGFHATTYMYDPSVDTWKQTSTAFHPRDGVASGVISGKLYVVGGRADFVGPYGLNFNEVYDPALVASLQWTVSNPIDVHRDTAAAHEGNYGLSINDNDTTSSEYAEHALNLSQMVVDVDWDMTSTLGIAKLQPQGRILLVGPSLARYGTLYYYNDGGTPMFKWYTGAFTALQSGSWNEWYHITIVWAGSKSKVVINGTNYPMSATQIGSDRIRLDTSMTEVSRSFFDTLRIRKYTSPQPTLSTGPEESLTLQGQLSVDTSPVKGAVFLNGSSLGTAPVSRQVDTGTYTISFGALSGYISPADQMTTVLQNTTTAIMGVYTPIPSHSVTVYSGPITGVNFTIDGALHQTNWAGSLIQGSHTISMPLIWIVGTQTYKFEHWEDGNTDPSRTIPLSTATIINATYGPYLGPVGTVNGTVIDSNSGEPIAGAIVTAKGYSTTTAANGTYALDVATGIYNVTVSATGYIDGTATGIVVNTQTTTTVNFTLHLNLLYWTQTTVSDFNAGNMDNVTAESDGDVALAETSGESVVFGDDFNNGMLDSGWTVDTPNKIQWVTIDLGSIYSLDTVKVYQSNFPYYFTKDYQIQVSVDNVTYTTVGNNTLLNSINDLEINILTATPARYVRILTLSYYTAGISQGLNEVEVFQAGYPNTNIALNKPATASSQWPSSKYAPNKAVDGLKGTTINSSPYPWLCADDAKADAPIVVTETNGSLAITAPNNDYAHIERTLGLTSDVQNLTVTARIDVQGDAGISWRPQIALYWAPGDWCGIGISNYDFITSANVYTSQTEGIVFYGGAAPNVSYYVKMVLTSTSIEFSESEDGVSWTTLRTVLRPSSYSGQPTLLIVGKGYGNGGFSQGGHTYPTPDLDNSLPSGGDLVTSYIDDVVVTASRARAYIPSGVFTSSIWDADFIATWKNVNWTSTLPQGTSITLQTRTGNTSTPDASWSNWSSIYTNSGESIKSPNGRYIQYRALLVTTDVTVTPVLRDVAITYVET
jgi:N-acetylneuraminic acid mutarotase